MMYLPRLCEHCLNPSCAASCPSGAIYKREEDGIVLIDQEKCRGWRMCVSGCPYKKIYYNWESGKSEKCTFCYPRIESGQPTVCSETCVGRIRYLGVVLYDADAIEAAASTENEQDLYQAQLDIFLEPARPGGAGDGAGRRRAAGLDRGGEALAGLQDGDGLEDRLPAASRVPHPADGLVRAAAQSPIQNAAEAGQIGHDGEMPDVRSLRIPVRYLANLLTAGKEAPIVTALERMLAMRGYMRAKTIDGVIDEAIAARVGLTPAIIEDMYKIMAIADYEERFVIPTAHRELAEEDIMGLRGGCGFTDGNGCSTGSSGGTLFGNKKRGLTIPEAMKQ